MEALLSFADILINLDKYLVQIVSVYGTATYLILFIIVFLETGAVIMPFLPGDSLLFAAGMVTANSNINIFYLFILLIIAAISGDNLNYLVGKYFSRQIKNGQNIPFIKKEYVDKTERFYAKYGNKTIMIARFVPMLRTLAPFFAGFGSLNYKNFIFYDITGGIVWVSLFLFGGHYFGNIQIVKDNFSIAIISVIFISIIPGIIEIIKSKYQKQEESGHEK